MSEFANLRDGGRQLAAALLGAIDGVPEPILLACMPNGVPVALGIREVIDIPVLALPVQRSDTGVVIAPMKELAGRNVIVVDDGVESGSVARAAAVALLASDVESMSLAVPVCARVAEADLRHRYDQVVTLVRPLVHRDLASHFDDFDTIDEAEATRLLAEGPA